MPTFDQLRSSTSSLCPVYSLAGLGLSTRPSVPSARPELLAALLPLCSLSDALRAALLLLVALVALAPLGSTDAASSLRGQAPGAGSWCAKAGAATRSAPLPGRAAAADRRLRTAAALAALTWRAAATVLLLLLLLLLGLLLGLPRPAPPRP
jgi:hypothetical protein